MDKRFLMILAAIVVIFGGLITYNKTSQTKTTANPTNHVSGKLDSKVVFVEYGDYQCNACRSFSAVTSQVRQKYNDKVKFQFRNMPITQIHPNSFSGARAAEAADMQGKFWEMHDLLYEQQDPTGQTGWVASQSVLSDYLVNYAKQLNLNVEKFKADYASQAVNGRINADIAEFDKTKAQKATPSFFLNGKQITLAELIDKDQKPSLDAFSKVLDAELARTK